jgi:hypothetical protein
MEVIGISAVMRVPPDAGALTATAQPRLWLTTSMLCPSGSSTNAP